LILPIPNPSPSHFPPYRRGFDQVQYVANCAWSYASLGVRDNAAWQALARESWHSELKKRGPLP
jgi:hypothetical protein